MMPGMIMIWHGTEETIPSGWHACDGTMGTPDLRDRIVLCPRENKPPGLIGGKWDHSHSFTVDDHSHDIPAGTGIAAGTEFDPNTSSDPAVGDTDAAEHGQPSMRLWFIMKL